MEIKDAKHTERHAELIRLLVEQSLAGGSQAQAERNLLACDECLAEFNAYRRVWRSMTDRENFGRWGAHLRARHPEQFVWYEEARARLYDDPAAKAADESVSRGWLSLLGWRSLAYALAVVLLLVVPMGWYEVASLQHAVRREQATSQKLLAETEALKKKQGTETPEKSVTELRETLRAQALEEQKQRERIDELRGKLKQYGKPHMNAVLALTLYGTRGPGDVQTIEWPKGKLYMSGYLPEVEESEYATYGLTMTDSAGKIFWQEDGLRKDEEGRFKVLIGREFLADGDYVLTIYGLAGGQRHRVLQHWFRIRSQIRTED